MGIPPISFTTFVDFLAVGATVRPRVVGDARDLHERIDLYSDYYAPLRRAISKIIRSSGAPDAEQTLARLVSRATAARRPNYERLGRAFLSWYGDAAVESPKKPPRSVRKVRRLSLILNPEIHAVINGVPSVVKLYFKGKRQPLQDPRLEVALPVGVGIRALGAGSGPGRSDRDTSLPPKAPLSKHFDGTGRRSRFLRDDVGGATPPKRLIRRATWGAPREVGPSTRSPTPREPP